MAVTEDELPSFAQVTTIANCDSRYFLVASTLMTKHFDEHFHAFVVDHTGSSGIIEDLSTTPSFLIHFTCTGREAFLTCVLVMLSSAKSSDVHFIVCTVCITYLTYQECLPNTDSKVVHAAREAVDRTL